MSKQFEDTPKLLSYISWNLKRIAEELERYNDREDLIFQSEKLDSAEEAQSLMDHLTPETPQEIDNNRLREFINKLDQGDTNGKIS